MPTKNRLWYLFKAMRPNQWVKNFVVYVAILFNGQLFNGPLFLTSTYAFLIFCAISSASYLLNDIIDLPYDKLHPVKKKRPLASGKVSLADASFAMFLLVLIALTGSLTLRIAFGSIIFIFFLIHVLYSTVLKRQILFDIFAISFSFMLRLFGGELITGYHVPIWLWLTTFFFSLFIASVKRHSEYINQGSKTRPVLTKYTNELLMFLVNAFAVLSIFSYSFYAFVEKPPHIRTKLSYILEPIFRSADTRKWFMLTVPFVVFGVARYAQLLYEQRQGEAPEKLVTQDKTLIVTILLWALVLVSLIYVI